MHSFFHAICSATSTPPYCVVISQACNSKPITTQPFREQINPNPAHHSVHTHVTIIFTLPACSFAPLPHPTACSLCVTTVYYLRLEVSQYTTFHSSLILEMIRMRYKMQESFTVKQTKAGRSPKASDLLC